MKRQIAFGLTVMLLLAFGNKCPAQRKQDTVYIAVDKTPGYDRKKKLFANYQINQLKNGALLVMLHTRTDAIARYRANDAKEIADRIMTEQTLENRLIVAAFIDNFHFCKVYFFNDTHLAEVKNGHYGGIFLNAELKEDQSITLKEKFFMVADYSPLEEESYEFIQEGGHPAVTQSTTNERSLILRDNYFVQMRPPFPYSISARITTNAPRQVAKLDKKLNKFYDKHKDANAVYPFTVKK